MRAFFCAALICTGFFALPAHAQGGDFLSPAVVQGLSNLAQAKAAYLTPTVSAWPTASAITYGQTLASSTLSGGTASVAGTFGFTTPSTVPGVGTYAAPVTFTPTDTATYFTVSGTVNVTVNSSGLTTPTVTAWPTASDIEYGQPLSASTLTGGTASVAGTFAFTDPNIVPETGIYTASVTFKPTDSTNYSAVAGTVSVNVKAATGDYTWQDYIGIPLLVLMSFGIVRLAEMDRLDGPCFIATAAWGTPLAPEVNRLRSFRDNTLLAGAAGTALVDVYYRVSPVLADAVASSPALAMLVRLALIPVIWLVSLPAPVLWTTGAFAGMLLIRRMLRRRRAE